MSWTEERVVLLRQLWGSGKSASEIAEILGGDLSRNAVIGKAHRLRLSGKAPVARKDDDQAAAKSAARAAPRAIETPAVKPAAEQAAQAAQAEPAAVAKKPAEVAQPAPSESAGASADIGATILNLTERMCKWPIGDPRDRDFHFCGKGVHGSFPYCAEHAAIAYQPPSSKRRDDDRAAARAS